MEYRIPTFVSPVVQRFSASQGPLGHRNFAHIASPIIYQRVLGEKDKAYPVYLVFREKGITDTRHKHHSNQERNHRLRSHICDDICDNRLGGEMMMTISKGP